MPRPKKPAHGKFTKVFPPPLDKPIKLRHPSLSEGLDEASFRRYKMEQGEQQLQITRDRLRILKLHYGIEPDSNNSWMLLSLALAVDFVPGLQAEIESVPPKWSRGDLAILLLEIGRRTRFAEMSTMEALRDVATENLKTAGKRITQQSVARAAASLKGRLHDAAKAEFDGKKLREATDALLDAIKPGQAQE